MSVAAHTAVPEGLFKHCGKHIARSLKAHLTFVAYSAGPGVLDHIAVSMPITFADEVMDPEVFEHAPVNEKDMEKWTMCKSHLMPPTQGRPLTKFMQIIGAFSVKLLLAYNSWVKGSKRKRS